MAGNRKRKASSNKSNKRTRFEAEADQHESSQPVAYHTPNTTLHDQNSQPVAYHTQNTTLHDQNSQPVPYHTQLTALHDLNTQPVSYYPQNTTFRDQNLQPVSYNTQNTTLHDQNYQDDTMGENPYNYETNYGNPALDPGLFGMDPSLSGTNSATLETPNLENATLESRPFVTPTGETNRGKINDFLCLKD